MQLEYQAFGKIYGTQVTKGKTGASLPPARSKPEYDWNRAKYSKVENEHKFCKQPPEHEGDCDPEAIRQTRREIKRKVAYIEGMPLGIDDQGRDRGEDTPGDITQECFLQALKKIAADDGKGCLGRLAGHKDSIEWARRHHNRREERRLKWEGKYAIERHGKSAPQFDVVLENGQETGGDGGESVPIVIEWTTPEALVEEVHQWALLQEAVKRSSRRYTQAVIALLMSLDEAPRIDRRRVRQELDALRKAVKKIEAEGRKKFTEPEKDADN